MALNTSHCAFRGALSGCLIFYKNMYYLLNELQIIAQQLYFSRCFAYKTSQSNWPPAPAIAGSGQDLFWTRICVFLWREVILSNNQPKHLNATSPHPHLKIYIDKLLHVGLSSCLRLRYLGHLHWTMVGLKKTQISVAHGINFFSHRFGSGMKDMACWAAASLWTCRLSVIGKNKHLAGLCSPAPFQKGMWQ